MGLLAIDDDGNLFVPGEGGRVGSGQGAGDGSGGRNGFVSPDTSSVSAVAVAAWSFFLVFAFI